MSSLLLTKLSGVYKLTQRQYSDYYSNNSSGPQSNEHFEGLSKEDVPFIPYRQRR